MCYGKVAKKALRKRERERENKRLMQNSKKGEKIIA
jgi:hypothetical protein